jgi:hypothetical protein
MQNKKQNDHRLYLRKLNTAQMQYTTNERNSELLSAIETCKECKIILLDYHYPIIVFTCHKNNNFNELKTNTSDCILHCLLLLEEYGVTFEYLPGKRKKNVILIVDALSCLGTESQKIQEVEEQTSTIISE